MNIKEMKPQSIERLVSIGLMLLVLGVFSQIAWHDFINFDDGIYVTENNHVQAGLSWQSIHWAFVSFDATNWHPVTWLSHMLDCELYGLNPAGHHLTNLFLHLANTLLLFLVLRTATGRIWESAMVAALFGIHPLHVESVAWVAERKDVLSGLFWMLTMLAYVHYCRKPGMVGYIGMSLLFAIGLMAKPMIVTLPFVLLLLDFWPLGRLKLSDDFAPPLKTLFGEKIPLFVLAIGSAIITLLAQSKGGAVGSFESFPVQTRILNALVSYVWYIKSIIFPRDMAVFYPYRGHSLTLWSGAAAALVLAAISALVIQQRTRRPFFLTGWLWFLGTLVPVIGLVQVGGQSMADRYTYLPSIGMFIMCVWGAVSIVKNVQYKRVVPATVGLAIVACLSVVAWRQLGYWQNTETLFRHALSVTEDNYVAHNSLGTLFLTEGDLDKAVSQYEKALDMWPDYPDALNNLGVVFMRKGLVKEAAGYYKEAVRKDPNHLVAHMNLGEALIRLNRLDEAAELYQRILRLAPDCGRAYSTMGVVLAKLNRMNEAVESLNKAIEICPACPEFRNNLGRVLTIKGDLEGAIHQLRQAVELRPTYAEALNNLGVAFMEAGNLEEALYYIASAVRVRPVYVKARRNMCRAASLMCGSSRTLLERQLDGSCGRSACSRPAVTAACRDGHACSP